MLTANLIGDLVLSCHGFLVRNCATHAARSREPLANRQKSTPYRLVFAKLKRVALPVKTQNPDSANLIMIQCPCFKITSLATNINPICPTIELFYSTFQSIILPRGIIGFAQTVHKL